MDPIPADLREVLEEYLPNDDVEGDKPFVTLTYAQSLDSKIAAARGQRTTISHIETKIMTHYIRSKHDAIVVGIGTVEADDPSLSCRYNNHDIKPVIVDPNFKMKTLYPNSKLLDNVKSGKGLEPIVVVSDATYDVIEDELESFCAAYPIKVIAIPLSSSGQMLWQLIFRSLRRHGLKSVMVEGGASVINALLLHRELVDSLVITIGPVFLGAAGVTVSPLAPTSLADHRWWQGQSDSVLLAHM